MRLNEYLVSRDESESAFARRVGLTQRTINRISVGAVRCRIDIAEIIVRASHDRPTLSGGVVTFEELIPSESAA